MKTSSSISKLRLATLIILLMLFHIGAIAVAQNTSTLIPASTELCQAPCSSVDAIVFVHGIFGDKETFTNKSRSFSWPEALDKSLSGEQVDVFRLNYLTSLIT